MVEHSVEDLLRQRICALALGYEDLNDHDELRRDALLRPVPKSFVNSGASFLQGQSLDRVSQTDYL